MRIVRAGFVTSALLAMAIHAHAGSVDAKLLGMLLTNGAITQAQHDELMADLAKEQAAVAQPVVLQSSVVQPGVAQQPPVGSAPGSAPVEDGLDGKSVAAFQQAAGWAARTALRGDLRFRNDRVNIEDEPKDGGRDRDRQRLRARLGVFTQVNPEVDTGIRIATGGSADRRSTNQDLDNYFDKKTVWLDLGYIDYHPASVPGLRLFAGKMRQPWLSVEEMVWDRDINPEGLAAQYTRALGTTTVFGSAGYYILKDNVDGDGVEWANDLGLYALQAGATFDVGERLRMTLGASANAYNNDGQQPGPDEPRIAMIANGNTTDEFLVYETFGQLDVQDLPVPLSLYGQYAMNADARDYLSYTDAHQDTGWLLGARTSVARLAFDYSYRDVERNAVVGYFTDSDFAAGYVGSKGHELRVSYEFLENFNVMLSWFLAESDAASTNRENADVETVMLDLNARF
jgi:hypothetical protein